MYETNTQTKDRRKEPVTTPSTLSELLFHRMPSGKGSGLRGQAGHSKLWQKEKSVSIFLGARVVIPGHQTLGGLRYPQRRYKQWGLCLGWGSVPAVHAHCAMTYTPCDMTIQLVAGVNPTVPSEGYDMLLVSKGRALNTHPGTCKYLHRIWCWWACV